MLGKNSADNSLKCFSYFFQEIGFDKFMQSVSLLETICMKGQSLFYDKRKKIIINLLSSEIAQRVVKVN